MGRKDFGGSRKKARAKGKMAVRKRNFRPVAPPVCCRLCERDLETTLAARDVGRIQPCGCNFCFTGGDRSEACVGIFNTLVSHVMHGRPVRAAQCPGCQRPAEQLQRVGPLGVVEAEELPLRVTAEEAASMRAEHPDAWGTDRAEQPVEPAEAQRQAKQRRIWKEMADQAAARDEECYYRAQVRAVLEEAGLVALLRDDQVCEQLDAYLASQHSASAPGKAGKLSLAAKQRKWFSSVHLSDASDRAGGSHGMLASRFRAVAQCCGAATVCGRPWAACDRAEAISYVRNRMVDAAVWPTCMRGRLTRAVV